MRIKTLLLCLAFTTAALAGDAPQVPAASAPGRYQLVSATTWMLVNGKKYDEPVVFKIDTQTGETWMLLLVTSNNRDENVRGFVPVPNLDKGALKSVTPATGN
ncbi:MAG TPA: hypothetical protein VKV04_08125 [Verrucomicrobiae bacterium]|nr:hypothetical protein [Verrucomicrobiae bacterium]